MNDKEFYKLIKITEASTKNEVVNFFNDCFEKEKVRVQVAKYDTSLPSNQRSINAYIGFEQFALLTADLITGRLIKKIEEAMPNGGYSLGYGGTPESFWYNGKPESRIITLGISKNKDKIYINVVRTQGVTTDTGAIKPDNNRDTSTDCKISVGVDLEKFRSMFIYTQKYIDAFTVPFGNNKYKEGKAEKDRRKKNNESTNVEPENM